MPKLRCRGIGLGLHVACACGSPAGRLQKKIPPPNPQPGRRQGARPTRIFFSGTRAVHACVHAWRMHMYERYICIVAVQR